MSITFAAVALALALFLPAKENPPIRPNKDGITQNDNRGTKSSPLVVWSSPRVDEEQTRKEKQKEDSEKSIRVWDAILTAFIAGAAIVQCVIYGKQAGIANRNLIATFRPKLIVRSVLVKSGDPLAVNRGKPWQVEFTISNIGGSVAQVVQQVAGAKFFEDHLLPAAPPYEHLSTDLDELSLEPGQHHLCAVDMPGEVEDGFIRMKSAPILGEIYFFGYLRYRDGNKQIRSMGFCRRHDPKTKRFAVVDDPDYEYAD